MAPIKPEAALDKAKKMYTIGKIESAIELLSECMKAQKKQKAWTKVHEDLMMFLAELCVECKKSLQFKEVIHQYKNMTAQVNPKSLEDVVKKYLHLAKIRTEEAKEKSQQQQMLEDVEDLENPETPESLILSVVNAEAEQERQDRTILTPWLKFLWESYRQCMELLRNNPRFERQYHDIVQEASEFCRKYDRKTEFKKLSEILRNHMVKLQNNLASLTTNTPQTTSADSWGFHHETRLKQLDQALNFQLYNEAFRAVEDIWNLLSTSSVTVKPRIAANYYAKTARVFFESGSSYLFHAAALHRLFFFNKENKKNISGTELEHMATQMVIASIAVPLPNVREPVDPLLESGEITSPVKQKQLSLLLKFPNPPTRNSLIKDIKSNRVHELVRPELCQLFKMLEYDYKPLSMAKEAAKVLEWLESDKEFHVYTDLIKQSIISKVLIQVGKVYKTIKIEEFEKLCPFVNKMKLLSIITNLIRNLELPVRIDFRSNILKFDVYTDLGISQRNDFELVTEEINGISSLARQLSKFSAAIYEVADFIGHKDPNKEGVLEWIRQSYMRTVNEGHQAMMNRKVIIEHRKEEIEQAEEEHTLLMNEHIRIQEERRRKEEINKLREEREQQQKRQMLLDKESNQKKMLQVRRSYLEGDEAGKELLTKYTEEELSKIDNVELAKMHNSEKQRMKDEEVERLRKLEQKVDYFNRALRLEELETIAKIQKENYVKARKLFEENEIIRREKAEDTHKMQLKDRELCLSIKSCVDEYVNEIQKQSKNDFQKKLDEYEKYCEEKREEYRVKRKEELTMEYDLKQQEVEVKQKEEEIRQKEVESKPKSNVYIPPSRRNKEAAAAAANRAPASSVTVASRNINQSDSSDNKRINVDENGWQEVTKR